MNPMSFGKLKRQFLFFAAVLLSLLFSCSSESETNSTKESGSDNFIKKMAADTTWKTYKGTIPCADCQAIAMDLYEENEG